MTEEKKNCLKRQINENSQTLSNLEHLICKNAMSRVNGYLNYFISQLSIPFEQCVYAEMRRILGQNTFKQLTPEDQYKYIFLQTMLINNEIAKEIKRQ